VTTRRPTCSKPRSTPGSRRQLGYTNVVAPFDGIVSAHLVSIGELVGVSSPTQLATIVALDPIYVNFNVNEQDVLRIREEARRRGMTADDLKSLPVEIGLQTESGFPHKGKLDYASPTINQSTGTLPVRGVLPIPIACCCPAITFGFAFPLSSSRTRCWSPTSPWVATSPDAMYWSSTARMCRTAQGPDRTAGR